MARSLEFHHYTPVFRIHKNRKEIACYEKTQGASDGSEKNFILQMKTDSPSGFIKTSCPSQRGIFEAPVMWRQKRN